MRRMVTDAEIRTALELTPRGKAAGGDTVLIEMLDELPRTGKLWLYHIVRRSLSTGSIPCNWRHSRICPILKPGKPPAFVTSYRPISLNSVIAKLCERVVAERLRHHLERLLHGSQFAFRRGRSTVDAIHAAVESILRHANTWELLARGRSVGLFYDLTQAFDMVQHDLLLRKLKIT